MMELLFNKSSSSCLFYKYTYFSFFLEHNLSIFLPELKQLFLSIQYWIALHLPVQPTHFLLAYNILWAKGSDLFHYWFEMFSIRCKSDTTQIVKIAFSLAYVQYNFSEHYHPLPISHTTPLVPHRLSFCDFNPLLSTDMFVICFMTKLIKNSSRFVLIVMLFLGLCCVIVSTVSRSKSLRIVFRLTKLQISLHNQENWKFEVVRILMVQ